MAVEKPRQPGRLVLKLELEDDAFSGTARRNGEPLERFSGWIGLAAILQRWCSGSPRSPEPRETSR